MITVVSISEELPEMKFFDRGWEIALLREIRERNHAFVLASGKWKRVEPDFVALSMEAK